MPDLRDCKKLSRGARNRLLRFAIGRGDEMECSTNYLLRPLDMAELEAAFQEKERRFSDNIARYEREKAEYNGDKDMLSPQTAAFLGDCSEENFAQYMDSLILQERETRENLRKEYVVNVSYCYTDKETLAFHQSLKPIVTFGYSNYLHEKCRFALYDTVRQKFLASSLCERGFGKEDWTHDFGYVYFKDISNLMYEDVVVYRQGRTLLETLSHEEYFAVDFDETDCAAFLAGKDGEKNAALLKKLGYAVP